MVFLTRFLAAATIILAAFSPASAVIIKGGDGSGNATAPEDNPGWANVGTVNGASCVYLGNGWVITASHVGTGQVTFGSASYDALAGSYTRLYEPSNPLQATDLCMFKLQTDPVGLSAVTITSTALASGSSIDAIGYGMNRATTETFWDNNWNVVGSNFFGGYAGYAWVGGNTKRWGTNSITHAWGTSVDDHYGVTDVWETAFNSSSGDSEMEAATGDSGGGVFYKRGSTWELTGIMLAIGTFENQPSDTAVFGDLTYFADLSVYSGEIAQTMGAIAVPEPGTLVLLLTGSVVGWFFWRRCSTARP